MRSMSTRGSTSVGPNSTGIGYIWTDGQTRVGEDRSARVARDDAGAPQRRRVERRGVPASPASDGHPGQAGHRPSGGIVTYSNAQVSAAAAAMDKYRGGDKGEVGAALAVVG